RHGKAPVQTILTRRRPPVIDSRHEAIPTSVELSSPGYLFHLPPAFRPRLSAPIIDEALQGSPGGFADRPSYWVGLLDLADARPRKKGAGRPPCSSGRFVGDGRAYLPAQPPGRQSKCPQGDQEHELTDGKLPEGPPFLVGARRTAPGRDALDRPQPASQLI